MLNAGTQPRWRLGGWARRGTEGSWMTPMAADEEALAGVCS